MAAALEQRRRKRQQATETLTLSVPVWLRFASDSVQGKRVADALSFPAAGPLTFSDAGTAVVRARIFIRTHTHTHNDTQYTRDYKDSILTTVAEHTL